MPVSRYTGNIFDTKADMIVIPVNCVGVAGAGLAKEWVERYPNMFKPYVKACKSGLIRPGRSHFMPYEIGKYFCAFPTKNSWRNFSVKEEVIAAFKYTIQQLHHFKIKDIAFPKIGCGLGGLNWNEVEQEILIQIMYYMEVWGNERRITFLLPKE